MAVHVGQTMILKACVYFIMAVMQTLDLLATEAAVAVLLGLHVGYCCPCTVIGHGSSHWPADRPCLLPLALVGSASVPQKWPSGQDGGWQCLCNHVPQITTYCAYEQPAPYCSFWQWAMLCQPRSAPFRFAKLVQRNGHVGLYVGSDNSNEHVGLDGAAVG